MKLPLAVLVLSAGCFSAGGAVSVNSALDDNPVRRVGGHVHAGTFTEIVKDRAVGSLFYSRDFGPLAGTSALDVWGARFATIGTGLIPGFYARFAYGQDDQFIEREASSVIAGAGASFGRMRPGVRGRGYAGLTVGLEYHRQKQETEGSTITGQFLGVVISVEAGFDLIGPMFGGDDDDD